MSAAMRSVVVGTAGLDVAAAIAVGLTVARGRAGQSPLLARAAARAGAVALLVQASHFAEEWAMGFDRVFPARLGLAPWPVGVFVVLNILWLGVWSLSVRRLRPGTHGWLFPLWFLGLAGVANAVAHPLLSVSAGGYFPGLLTAPAVGVAGLVLLRHLTVITSPDRYQSK